MFIGELNPLLGEIRTRVVLKDTDIPAQPEEGGDPFGTPPRPLRVRWERFFDTGVDIHFGFSGDWYIDGIAVTLGGRPKGNTLGYSPDRLTLYTGGKARMLDTYAGETGRPIREERVFLSVREHCRDFVLTVDADYARITLDSITVIGSDLSGEELFPIPRQTDFTGERTDARRFASLSFPPDFASAGELLASEWKERTGLSLSVGNDIRLMSDLAVPANGYCVCVEENNAQIAASDLTGAVMGVWTLFKLLKDDGTLPLGTVTDAPVSEFRGVHLALPSAENIPFFRRLVRYMLSPMGYNTVILEVSGGLKYRSHPEISEAYADACARAKRGELPAFPHGHLADGRPLEGEQLRELADYIRSFGMEPVPELSSLSHVQYLTWAHPEIGEREEEADADRLIDQNAADVPPNRFYTGCWCPSLDAPYELYFDLADEVIDLMRPRYFHIGHDEVYQMGVCPRCRDKDPAALFAADVTKIHDHLKARGIRTVMWSDMLQPVTSYRTPPARKLLPRDILMMDFIWYFHLDKDIEDNLLEEGFPLIIGNLYSSHYPRYEQRRAKAGMLGGQISSWVRTDEGDLGREGKLYDFVYTANMLWSRTVPEARTSYDALIRRLMPRLRQSLRGVSFPSLTPSHKETGAVPGAAEELTWPGGVRADSLLIAHTALTLRRRVPWKELPVVGHYTVTYADGSLETIPVTYGGNVGYAGRRPDEPLTEPYFRHNGYTATYFSDPFVSPLPDGKPGTWYRYEWINPRPDVPLTSVRYESADSMSTEGQTVIALRSAAAVTRG